MMIFLLMAVLLFQARATAQRGTQEKGKATRFQSRWSYDSLVAIPLQPSWQVPFAESSDKLCASLCVCLPQHGKEEQLNAEGWCSYSMCTHIPESPGTQNKQLSLGMMVVNG